LSLYLLYRALCSALRRLALILTRRKHLPIYGRKKVLESKPRYCRFPRKPDWVPKEIVRMKALMWDHGCRKLAEIFNRRFAGKESVGKTYVYNVLVQHRHEIALLRRNLKKRKPRPMPHNLIWGLDLTGKPDSNDTTHNILGIVEHASRASLVLIGLKDKATITLLRYLLDTVECYGKPKIVRTDNESVFISRLFRFGLWLLGIKHQKTDKGCPWMNGRMERFFGTLKEKLDRWEIDSLEQLNGALGQFRAWYNFIRPHQNLQGRTPAEVWQGVDIFANRPRREFYYSAWNDLLTGYYLRL
nr:transposase family protein [Nitrospinaceae bacterium]NIS83729.1 transposase family protein [Nitrospinaceae bacterium]NIT80526.1 transposase family protein [Nitrospinaceae bacterium]NIU42853.1 transposase family protein [Nitrospinaceae bacterium]NIU94925.1 DDE-type integrase/transposase/recombinase [Nitrospinaceae bacterium]